MFLIFTVFGKEKQKQNTVLSPGFSIGGNQKFHFVFKDDNKSARNSKLKTAVGRFGFLSNQFSFGPNHFKDLL